MKGTVIPDRDPAWRANSSCEDLKPDSSSEPDLTYVASPGPRVVARTEIGDAQDASASPTRYIGPCWVLVEQRAGLQVGSGDRYSVEWNETVYLLGDGFMHIIKV